MPHSATGLLVDAQLPPVLARRLTATGIEAVHIVDRLRPTATDLEVVALANELGAAVMSKDADFLDLLDRQILQTGLVWVRCGNVRPGRLWSIVEPQLDLLRSALASGQRLLVIR